MNESRKFANISTTAGGEQQKTPLSDEELEQALTLIQRLNSPKTDMSPQLIGLASRIEYIKKAREELASRRRRIGIFGNTMFSETGWEILLTLYGESNLARQNISRVTERISGAPTTTLRWLDYLEGQGYITRQPHPTDTRSVLLELTGKAVSAMDLYFSERPGSQK